MKVICLYKHVRVQLQCRPPSEVMQLWLSDLNARTITDFQFLPCTIPTDTCCTTALLGKRSRSKVTFHGWLLSLRIFHSANITVIKDYDHYDDGVQGKGNRKETGNRNFREL
jgi:hypothetical protein